VVSTVRFNTPIDLDDVGVVAVVGVDRSDQSLLLFRCRIVIVGVWFFGVLSATPVSLMLCVDG
jgi:hypothetical protein